MIFTNKTNVSFRNFIKTVLKFIMKLSIIIPVYNEIDQLNKTIKRLISLKKKLKFELIFIDDFSNDGSFGYIKKYKKRFNFIKVFKNKKKGLGSAIETGIKNSKN